MPLLLGAILTFILVEVYCIKSLKAVDNEVETLDDLVPVDKSELPSWGRGKQPVRSVSKISPGNYEWQATTYTRQQIDKLVNSDEYKRQMRERGDELSAWNWKTKELEDGKLPPDEDTMIKHPINLMQEMNRVDAELSESKKRK